MTAKKYEPILPLHELALTSLQEEMGEVAIEISKGKRFGWNTANPYDPAGSTPTERLAMEIGDLLGSIEFVMKTHPGLSKTVIIERKESREARLLHTNNRNAEWEGLPE